MANNFEYSVKPGLEMLTNERFMSEMATSDAFFSWLLLQDMERQEKYRQYREYYEGDHDAALTDRQATYLEVKPHTDFSVNFCHLVVNQLARRLNVAGFEAEKGTLGGKKGVLWRWWRWAQLQRIQRGIYIAAIRDGDTYLIMQWNDERQMPEFHHNLAFNGTEGVIPIYDDETGKMVAAIKRWQVVQGSNTYYRANMYEPQRVTRWVSDNKVRDGAWRPFTGDGREAIIPWIDRNGRPLGLPVFHIRYGADGNRYGLSVIDKVIPAQNALNKTVIDLIAAADTTAFRVYTMTGDRPVDEDGKNVKISPGVILSTTNENARIGFMPGENLRPLIEVVDAFKILIAQITQTPLHLFQVSGQNASEGAQKQQEVGIISQAEDAAISFGDNWEDAMRLGVRMHNAFVPGGNLDTTGLIETLWGSFEIRDRDDRVLTMSETTKNLVDAGSNLYAAARAAGFDHESAISMTMIDLMGGQPIEQETNDADN